MLVAVACLLKVQNASAEGDHILGKFIIQICLFVPEKTFGGSFYWSQNWNSKYEQIETVVTLWAPEKKGKQVPLDGIFIVVDKMLIIILLGLRFPSPIMLSLRKVEFLYYYFIG